MVDLNQVTVIGRAVRDAELRTTKDGKNIANVCVAVSGQGDRTSFFDVVMFDTLAELAAKYVTKGKQVAISGSLQQRKWEDKKGEKRYSVEIIGRVMQLLGAKQEAQDASQDKALEDIDDKPIDLSEIPF